MHPLRSTLSQSRRPPHNFRSFASWWLSMSSKTSSLILCDLYELRSTLCSVLSTPSFVFLSPARHPLLPDPYALALDPQSWAPAPDLRDGLWTKTASVSRRPLGLLPAGPCQACKTRQNTRAAAPRRQAASIQQEDEANIRTPIPRIRRAIAARAW